MFSLFTYCIATVLMGTFIYLDGPNIVKHTAVVKWKKFRKVNRLVATNYKGFFTILWVSVCMIGKALWLTFLQYINSTIQKLDGNKYLVTYVIKGKTYKMIVKPTRGPRKVLMVSDEKQQDVSSLVFPYLGPEENFHGEVYTPSFFDRDELIFELSSGVEKIFKKDDNISLS